MFVKNRPPSLLMLAVGLLSLVFSGAGSLLAQAAIQKYVSVKSGGADAFISIAISFAFIGGIAGGAIIGGFIARRWPRLPIVFWVAAELASAATLPVFIQAYRILFDSALEHWAFQSADLVHYYIFLFVFLAVSCGSLAAVMGANYPLAYAALSPVGRGQNKLAMLLLASNTVGAAAGCALSIYVLPLVTLPQMLQLAAGLYVVAGLLPLLLRVGDTPTNLAGRANASIGEISISCGAFLLFAVGYIGFSYEVLLFRHFGLVEPNAYWLFSGVLGILLVSWAAGNYCSIVFGLKSAWVLALLVLTQVFAAALLVLFHGGGVIDLSAWPPSAWHACQLVILFLPILFSGWYFGAVHREVRTLNARDVGLLYTCNLGGTFLGGVVATYVLPDAMGVSFVFIPFIGAMMTFVVGAAGYLPRAPQNYAWAGLVALVVLAMSAYSIPFHRHSDNYYRSVARLAPGTDITVKEDWTTSAWLAGGNFVVGGRVQVPNVAKACAGFRSQQMLLPAILKKNARILYIGVAAGISNGALGQLLPESQIVNVDYSKAVSVFWKSHPDMSFNLIHQPNQRAVVMDGRLALILEAGQYDSILEFATAEGVRGASSIKSLEFLKLVKARMHSAGAFISVGYTSAYAATLQSVFRNVWLLSGVPIMISSDADAHDLFLDHVPQRLEGKLGCLDSVIRAKATSQSMILLRKIDNPLITDERQLADYQASSVAIDRAEHASAPQYLLPFLSAPNISLLNDKTSSAP